MNCELFLHCFFTEQKKILDWGEPDQKKINDRLAFKSRTDFENLFQYYQFPPSMEIL